MIDLTKERPIPLEQATGLIPPAHKGKRTHLSTLVRWIVDGARRPDGTRVQLEAVRLGGRWMTTAQAIQRFADALTPNLRAQDAKPPRSPAARQRSSERAARELDKAGI
jgi:hypothetical protein